MGQAALIAARRFDPDRIAGAYEELFDELAAARRTRDRPQGTARWRGSVRRTLSRLRP
jgi:hypothetical protein